MVVSFAYGSFSYVQQLFSPLALFYLLFPCCPFPPTQIRKQRFHAQPQSIPNPIPSYSTSAVKHLPTISAEPSPHFLDACTQRSNNSSVVTAVLHSESDRLSQKAEPSTQQVAHIFHIQLDLLHASRSGSQTPRA
ncbi:hypothetical protein CC80DRAFT_92095 [Byssothecium circinans]|uniref:Uncharacterized protein n=1 Tax=Byssothecium circinans TaxID=147558 RepID=A0A6A5U2D4_9PLEO|nr:hypothetical protein CC80DRAFT_92095 [Byssothecium circinans]